MKKSSIGSAILLLIILIMAIVYVDRARQESAPVEPRKRVRIAVPPYQTSALVILADALGHFRDERLDVSLEFRPTGRDCLDLVLKGEADYAVVFETPVVHAALAGGPIRILTTIHRAEENSAIVARSDRGIRSATDLVGKKVAVVPKTNAEFLLSLYLSSNLVDARTVKTVPMTAKEAVEAVRSGTVDASALWEPYLTQALGTNEGFRELRTSFYSEFSMVVTVEDKIQSEPDVSTAIVRALKRAQASYDADETSSQNRVDSILERSGVHVSSASWRSLDIRLGLYATLIAMLNEEARWAAGTDAKMNHPDLESLVEPRFLRSVSPELVTFE